MLKKINIMVPTHKRPDGLFRVINSAYKTADKPENLIITLCVNRKDYLTMRFIRNFAWPYPLNWRVVFEDTKQPNLALYFNMMCETAKKDEVVSMIGDDMEFLTPGWDTRVLNVINAHDGKAVVFCDDKFTAHDTCAVNLFTPCLVVDAMEKPFMCPRYAAEMIDVIWTWTGRLAGILHYLPDVFIQHHHGSAPGAEADETFNRLSPIRQISNQKEQYKWSEAYSVVCAGNLIKNGVGEWNILS